MEWGKTFEHLRPYLQEENSVSEKIGKTIIEMVQITILAKDIDNTL